jgi:ribose/xylose/arabinose/galactoside ABC-type transport system permease subunit
MTDHATIAPAPRARSRRFDRVDLLDALFVPTLLAGVVVFFAVKSDTFLSGRNIQQILLGGAGLAIAAAGVTFAIIAGQLDLSMGTTAALSGVVAAKGMTEITSSVTIGVLLGLGLGLGVGLVNGFVTAVLRVPSFVTTLGTGVAVGGLALVFTDGSTVSGVPDAFPKIANTEFLGLRSLVWIAIGVFVVAAILLHGTGFGIRVFAIGDSAEAARLAGIRVGLVTWSCLAISGVAAGTVGVLLASRVRAATPGAHGDLALTAIAAVVLGGTSIAGGSGSMAKTFWGVMLIAVLKNGLDNIGLEFSYQNIVIGVVFVLAASSEVVRRRVRISAAAAAQGSGGELAPDPQPAHAEPASSATRN